MKNKNIDIHEPKFPIEIFPNEIREYISACHECLNLVPEFMATAVISAIATIIGNSFSLKIKEGWYERGLLWFVIVGSSGMRKSPSINKMISPLHKIDKKFYDDYKFELEAISENQKGPNPRQLILTDTTNEALISALESNPNGLLHFSDELMSWINGFQRYNSSGAEEQWLSMFNGYSIKLNRKTNKEVVRIEKPFVNVLGGIQPERLKELFGEKRSVNGFTSRLLFVFPPRMERTTSNMDIPLFTIEAYNNFINRFAGLNDLIKKNEPDQHIVEFDMETRLEYNLWIEREINSKLNSDSIGALEGAVLPKLEAICARFALILHIIDAVANKSPIPQYIGVSTLKKAQKLVAYYYSNFQKVARVVFGEENYNEPKELKIYRKLVPRLLAGNPIKAITKDLHTSGFSIVDIGKAINMHRNSVSNFIKSA